MWALSVILIKTFDCREGVKRGVKFLSFNRVFILIFSAYTETRLSCFVSLLFAKLLQLEMSNFDSQKTRGFQHKIKIAVSTQYAYKLQQKCDRLRVSLAMDIFELFGDLNKISWQHFHLTQAITHLVGTKHQMSGHCLLDDQTSKRA